MILSSTDALRVVLANAITTTQPTLYAAYVDVGDTGSTFEPNVTGGTTNSTTSVDWLGAPASGKKRQIKHLVLRNEDSLSVTATISYYNGTTTRTMLKVTLLTSESLVYLDTNGWVIFDGTGSVRESVVVNETGQHAVWIAAGSMSPSFSGGCASLSTIASIASAPDIQTLNFDPTTQEYAQFSIKMPSSWDEGTVQFRPVWSHAATTTNFGVVWTLQGVAVSNDDPIGVSFGTAQSSVDTGGTTDDIYFGPTSSAITLSGSPQVNDIVFFRVSRLVSDGSDNMAVDARLHGIELLITTSAGTDS